MSVVSEYLKFLENKTEEEVVEAILKLAKRAGFHNIEEIDSLSKGDRVYYRRGNFLALAVIGDGDEGRIVVSHVDAPRIDLKPRPFVEMDGYVYLKTHYYGGIKPYQWIGIPLEIRGKVVTVDGEEYSVSIPTVITDFAPHLDRNWKDKKVSEAFDPEKLEPIVALGTKEGVLEKIKDEFGVEEADFLSADLKLVPRIQPEIFGAHRELIMAYGHDDRSCVFSSARAIMDADYHGGISVALFVDREETGSTTDGSAASRVVDHFLITLLRKLGKEGDFASLLDFYARSKVISADVTAGYDPLYGDLYDKENAPKLGNGVVVSRYSGTGGKYYGSEASAGYVAWIRRVLEENEVPYQPGTLGKVGKAGGGTVATYFAVRGADVVDMGPAVLSMHSPVEVMAGVDLESAYRAYRHFYEWVD